MKNSSSQLLAFILFLLTSCTSPDNEPLTKENLEAISKTNALTGEEFQLLQAYTLRTGFAGIMSGKSPEDILDSTITIREAIDKQKKWAYDDSVQTANEEMRAKAALAAHEKELARLRTIVTVTPVKKQFDSYEYQEYNTFKFAIKNSGEKAIRGFKGGLVVNDLFGDRISKLEIKYDDKLDPGKDKIISSSYSYNQFMDNDSKLRFTPLEKLKFSWEPEIIIFIDGEELKVAELENQ